MLDTLEQKIELEKIVTEINELKQDKKYMELSIKVEELLDLYLSTKIPQQVRNHIEEYVERFIINSEENLELEHKQTSIKVGRDYIRQGAWRDENEEEINLNYFHRLNISKYVEGFTCGNLKYEYAYPNQVIESINCNSEEMGYKIYRYIKTMNEIIEVRSIKIADNLVKLRKIQTVYNNQEIQKEATEIIYYEETPFGNIEIENPAERVFMKKI